MSHDIPHLMSFRLANATPPQLPSYLSGYVRINPSLNHLQIYGNISGAPTPQILDCLIEQGVQLASSLCSFSLLGNTKNACAFAVELSPSGDKRYIRLLNERDDLADPTAPPFRASLRPGCDAVLSKMPQGPFCVVANNLMVSDGAKESLGLTSSGAVYVENRRVGWHVVRPQVRNVLDAALSFSPTNGRLNRSHLANIAKLDAQLTFCVATDAERAGEGLLENVYLIDLESTANVFPPSKLVLGDVALTPVFPYDSAEGDLMRSITERLNRLIKNNQ